MKMRYSVLAVQAALACAALGASASAFAADDKDVAEIKAQIKEMRDSYEARLKAMEARLAEVQAQNEKLRAASAAPVVVPGPALAATPVAAPVLAPEPAPATAAPASVAAPAGASMANLFNPSISMILIGTYANLSQDPKQYRLQGFIPSGADAGPGKRGFGLGESELTLAASIDPHFSGQMTFTLDGDHSVGVEEAFVQTNNLADGVNLKFGRFYSALGYQNSQHSHVWDFADVPLVYTALLGGQTSANGLQLKWLAPTDRFFELGAEVSNASTFPAGDDNHNGVGSSLLFAHLGDDIGDNGSWRAGLSYLRTRADGRQYTDVSAVGNAVTNAFTGHSQTWIVDGIAKWTFPGKQSFKLQSEYLRRKEDGRLAFDVTNPIGAGIDDSYQSRQSGWYLQAVYQFHPEWRVGVRYDRLSPGAQNIGLVESGRLSAANFPILDAYHPSRIGLILDWNGSEFSRIRLQLARDQSRPGVTDNQVYLQYIMSLGAHGAHSF